MCCLLIGHESGSPVENAQGRGKDEPALSVFTLRFIFSLLLSLGLSVGTQRISLKSRFPP